MAVGEFLDIITKITEKKSYILNKYLMQVKVPYSGKKKKKNNVTQDIISKGEK